MKRWLGLASLIFTILLSAELQAGSVAEYFAEEDPGQGLFTSRNQAPLLNLLYVIPVTRAQTLGKNHFEFHVDFDLSSINEIGNANGYNLLYDMEIYRTSFHFTYGILDQLDLHLEIPTLSTNGGFLDGFIQDYHNAFNAPSGDRELRPNGGYGYILSRNGQTIFGFPQEDFAIADINLDLKWQVLKDEKDSLLPALALRTGIKFPSGDFNKGTGSGEVDYGFGFTASKAINRFHLYIGFDGIIIEDPETLRGFIDEEILHWFFGVEWVAVKQYLSVVIQIDGQTTPFIETGLEQLDNEVLEIVPGLRGGFLDNHFFWQASMREDLIPDSTVDFTAALSLGARF